MSLEREARESWSSANSVKRRLRSSCAFTDISRFWSASVKEFIATEKCFPNEKRTRNANLLIRHSQKLPESPHELPNTSSTHGKTIAAQDHRARPTQLGEPSHVQFLFINGPTLASVNENKNSIWTFLSLHMLWRRRSRLTYFLNFSFFQLLFVLFSGASEAL